MCRIGVLLEIIHMSFLYPFKNNVAFKFVIELVINYY
jgi:hypothetical protein